MGAMVVHFLLKGTTNGAMVVPFLLKVSFAVFRTIFRIKAQPAYGE